MLALNTGRLKAQAGVISHKAEIAIHSPPDNSLAHLKLVILVYCKQNSLVEASIEISSQSAHYLTLLT